MVLGFSAFYAPCHDDIDIDDVIDDTICDIDQNDTKYSIGQGRSIIRGYKMGQSFMCRRRICKGVRETFFTRDEDEMLEKMALWYLE